jgi:hypothetical protein
MLETLQMAGPKIKIGQLFRRLRRLTQPLQPAIARSHGTNGHKAAVPSLLRFRCRGNRGRILDKAKFVFALQQPLARLAVALFGFPMLRISRIDWADEI